MAGNLAFSLPFGGSSGSAPTIAQSDVWANRANYQIPGNVVRFTDIGGGTNGNAGGSYWFYTEALRWKAYNGQCLIDSIDSSNAGVADTSEQNLNPNVPALPAGVIQATDRLYLKIKASKSGGVDTGNIRVRIGSTKTTADALITAPSFSATQVAAGFMLDFKRISATSIRREGGLVTNSLGGGTTSAYPSIVPLTGADNFDTSPIYITLWQLMTGGTEFLTIIDYSAVLESTDS